MVSTDSEGPGTAKSERLQPDPSREQDSDAAIQARARALSSPIRLRILRLCRFTARTNKEIAEILGANPGTTLHHIRTLVRTGFLVAESERSGAQGAREVPYRATDLSWNTRTPGISPVLVDTFIEQIAALDPEDVKIAWLGLILNDAHLAELEERLYALITEFKERGADADGKPYSLFNALHPDLNPVPSAEVSDDVDPRAD